MFGAQETPMEPSKPKIMKLDDIDLLILQLYYNQDHDPDHKGKPRYSVQEINEAVTGLRSVSTIHDRIAKLERAGYIHNPFKKAPRSRTITDEGIQRLRNGLGMRTTGSPEKAF
jgi:SOS-response transcriptional repressor LexA